MQSFTEMGNASFERFQQEALFRWWDRSRKIPTYWSS